MQLFSSSNMSFQRAEGGLVSQPGPRQRLEGLAQRKAGDRLSPIQQGQQETPGFSGIVLPDASSLPGW